MGLMDDNRTRTLESNAGKGNFFVSAQNSAFGLFKQIPQQLQNCLQSNFKKLVKERQDDAIKPQLLTEIEFCSALDYNLDKQMQAWRENSSWIDESPEIKVNVPKGSLCNLNVNFKVGLPPDAIYNIVVDPDNKRVFKNIEEVISRKVLVDEGSRQVVELEQAAIWRFLWWSGTISVHVLVDQNRKDHTVKFKQGKSGFMKRFEGCWKVEPLFVDEHICSPFKPETWSEYESCTGGKGRVGSIVSLEQLVQPALVPPPPISWYLRGITARTIEMLIYDLLAESARLRGGVLDADRGKELETTCETHAENLSPSDYDIKERWCRRRDARRRSSRRVNSSRHD